MRVVKLRRNFGKAAALSHGFAAAPRRHHGHHGRRPPGRPRRDRRAPSPRSTRATTWCPGWKQSRQDPFTKTLPSRVLQLDGAQGLGIPLHDFNCGLKAYRRDVVETITIYGELHRYIPVVAAQAGFRVTEVKVNHRRRTAGRSKYGWQRYLRGYLDLLTVLFLGRYQHRPQHLFGGIGTLADLHRRAGRAVSDGRQARLRHAIGQRPLLLLGALLIIVGVQLLSLGLIGELIANSRARSGPDPAQVAVVVGPAAVAAAPRRGPVRTARRHRQGRRRSCRPRSRRSRPGRRRSRDPGRRVLRHVRPGLPAQRRAHRRPPRARRRGARVPRAAAGADGGEMATPRGAARLAAGVAEAHVRLLGAASPATSRSTPSSSATPGTSSCRSAALLAAFRRAPLVFDPLVSLLDTFAGDRGLVRAGGPEGGRRARGRSSWPSGCRRWCSPTRGRTPRTTSEHFGLPRASAGRGAGRRAAGAARRRSGAPRRARRAAHRAPVRQVEPAPRRRRRPGGGRAAAGRAGPLRAGRRGSALRRAARDASPRRGSTTSSGSARFRTPSCARGRWRRTCASASSAARRRRLASYPTRSSTRSPAAGPVVTADSAGARELLQDGEDALLVPAGDAAALAAALRRLLRRGERARLGQAALALYRARVHAGRRRGRPADRAGGLVSDGGAGAAVPASRAPRPEPCPAAALAPPPPRGSASLQARPRGGDRLLPRRLPGALLGQHRVLRVGVRRRLARALRRRLPRLLLRAGGLWWLLLRGCGAHQPLLAGGLRVG